MHCNDSTRFTRRTALRCLAGAAMSGLAACATTATGQSSFFARTGLPIGLQVYTLGEQAGQDIDATFLDGACNTSQTALRRVLGWRRFERGIGIVPKIIEC